MRCSKCSASQKLEDIYCPNCGALIEVPEDDQYQVTTGFVSGEASYIAFSRLFADSVSKLASQLGFRPGSIWRRTLSWMILLILAVLIVSTMTPGIL